MSAPLNVLTRGQVFTPDEIVTLMLSLRQNAGRILEPSAGDGAFFCKIPGCVGLELDPAVAPPGAILGDFFAYPTQEKFDTIIGNPPYVRYQDIGQSTKALLNSTLFDARSNLFLFFVEKAILHLNAGGELIFIVPREMMKLTAARRLNAWLYEQGTITHWIETGDQKLFQGAVPNCAIFRFVRGETSRETQYRNLQDRTWQTRRFVEMDGQLAFLEAGLSVPLSALFDVKVGAVSGADPCFEHPEGNMEFVCSKTRDTGQTRRMFYNVKHPALEPHKETLLARRIRNFDDANWWHWGRAYPVSDSPRIYVNGKTRRPQPFFVHDCTAYDGSMLALFPKIPGMDLTAAAHLLNTAVPWEQLGFVVDGRFLFTQRTLATCLLPDAFRDLLRPTRVPDLPAKPGATSEQSHPVTSKKRQKPTIPSTDEALPKFRAR